MCCWLREPWPSTRAETGSMLAKMPPKPSSCGLHGSRYVLSAGLHRPNHVLDLSRMRASAICLWNLVSAFQLHERVKSLPLKNQAFEACRVYTSWQPLLLLKMTKLVDYGTRYEGHALASWCSVRVHSSVKIASRLLEILLSHFHLTLSIQGHHILASALLELKEYQKMVTAMESALKSLPGHPELQAILAKAQKLGGNNTFEGNQDLGGFCLTIQSTGARSSSF